METKLKYIYALGNRCSNYLAIKAHFPEYYIESVFQGVAHNQAINSTFAPLFLFDQSLQEQIINRDNWIELRIAYDDNEYKNNNNQFIPVFIKKGETTLENLYYEFDWRLQQVAEYDKTKLVTNQTKTSFNKTATSYYNTKTHFLFEHGSAFKTLDLYVDELKRRLETFNKHKHEMLFIYQFDYFVRRSHLVQFEDFLVKNNYNLEFFKFCDQYKARFAPTKIFTHLGDTNSFLTHHNEEVRKLFV